MNRRSMTATMLRRALRRWPPMTVVLVTMVAQAGVDLLRPWPLKIVVDNVLGGSALRGPAAAVFRHLPGGHGPRDLLTWAVAATVAVFLVGWLVGLVEAYAQMLFGQALHYDLAAEVFEHLQRLSLRFHGGQETGDSLRRITTDSGSVATIVQSAVLPAVAALVTIVVTLAVMVGLDVSLTAAALVAVPVMVLTVRRYGPPIGARSEVQQEAESHIFEVVEQTLTAIPEVQAFGREADLDRRFRRQGRTVVDTTVALTVAQLRFKVATGAATAVAAAAIFWIGGHEVLAHRLSTGTLLVFLAYLATLYAQFETLMEAPATIEGAAGSAGRVLEVLGAEPEVVDRVGAPPLPAVAGGIGFEGVSFGYEPGRPVLREVWLEVSPGETVAVVGPTGAGKTTLVSMVLRLFDPWAGVVRIDGWDLREVALASVRAQVAVVLQEPFLFPVSVAANIAYGRRDASRAEVVEAARAANAHEFICALPEGYDTVVGERGGTLSGGERQRVAVARALLRDAPILVLDEPTSALDAGSEQLLLEALRRLMAGRTTLIIAHRLSTIRDADRIAVVDGGRVVECGSHGELVAAGGVYARLYGLQTAPVGDGGPGGAPA